jgi:hypothetical protein
MGRENQDKRFSKSFLHLEDWGSMTLGILFITPSRLHNVTYLLIYLPLTPWSSLS